MQRILTLGLALAALVLVGACGSEGGAAVPKGEPTHIVRGAADRTIAAGTAHVFIDGPDGRHSEGVVDLRTRTGTLKVKGADLPERTVPFGATDGLPDPYRRIEYTDPAAVAELVRHAETVDPFGGLSVRGVGAVRYDIHIRLPGQQPFFADAYIDAKGRLRRLTVAEARDDHRVTDREYRLARLITVDFVFE